MVKIPASALYWRRGNSALALQRLSRSIASAREGVNWITGCGDIHRLCNFQDGVPDDIAAAHNAVPGLLVGSRQVESPIVCVYQCVHKHLVHVRSIHLREPQKGDCQMADVMTIVVIFAPFTLTLCKAARELSHAQNTGGGIAIRLQVVWSSASQPAQALHKVFLVSAPQQLQPSWQS